MKTEDQLPPTTVEKTKSDGQSVKPPEKTAPRKDSSLKRTVGIVVLSFVAGILGAWASLASGLVQPDATETITQNRDKLVLQQGEIVSDVAEKVAPSVVSIVTEGSSRTPFGVVPTEGAGTGIIISPDGYIITNKHVIPASANNVTVVRSDGTVIENVSVVGRDPLNDLAFLKIENASNLPAAELANSDEVQIGQQVVAIGNALGQFQNTVTSGIISGIGRPITAGTGNDTERLEDLFQTDAAINPGNSGGPLVNLEGKIIGINTAIAQEAQGIGFAIPINAAKGLIETVRQDGKVSRAYLGVRYVMIDQALADERKLSVNQGAYIASGGGQSAIVNNGPADKAGVEVNDIITKVDGQQVNERHSLSSLLAKYKPGDTVTLVVVRDGDEREIKVTLEELQA